MGIDSSKKTAVVAGAGPAGLTCALYLSRAGFETTVYTDEERSLSQLAMTERIENYPGFPHGVDAVSLLDLMNEQAACYGTGYDPAGVDSIDADLHAAKLSTGKEVRADAFVIAVGAEPAVFSFPGSDRIGIHTCAVCDGSLYAGLDTAVIGGGDTAFGDALYLAGICRRVTMLIRRDVARVSNDIALNAAMGKENIDIRWKTQISSIEVADDRRIMLHLDNGDSPLTVDGVFSCIGVKPRSIAVTGEKNGVVWECGDCRPNAARQVSCAVGDGARTALEIISLFQMK